MDNGTCQEEKTHYCILCVQEFPFSRWDEAYCPDCDPTDRMNEQYRKDIESGLI